MLTRHYQQQSDPKAALAWSEYHADLLARAGLGYGAPMPVVIAALLYFGIVFGVGFLLGPIRVLWLEPRFGSVLASLCEAPFLIIAMIVAARWIPKMLLLARDPQTLMVVGLAALLLQQVADFLVGIGLRGITLSEQLAHFATPEGLVYSVLLILFGLMPVLINRNVARRIQTRQARLAIDLPQGTASESRTILGPRIGTDQGLGTCDTSELSSLNTAAPK